MPEPSLLVAQSLGIVFAVSTAAKLRHPLVFARGVAAYEVVPPRLSHATAFLVIALEGTLAIVHITGWFIFAGAIVGLVLLSAFALVVTRTLRAGHAKLCQCFGQRQETVSGRTLSRILLLAIGELFLVAQSGEPSAGMAEAGVSALSAALFVMSVSWVLAVPDVVAILRPCNTCAVSKSQSDARSQHVIA